MGVALLISETPTLGLLENDVYPCRLFGDIMSPGNQSSGRWFPKTTTKSAMAMAMAMVCDVMLAIVGFTYLDVVGFCVE